MVGVLEVAGGIRYGATGAYSGARIPGKAKIGEMGHLGNRIRRRWLEFSSDIVVTKSAALSLDEPLISFTFDDFPQSAARVGAQILERHGACGTFYTSGSLCGRMVDGIQYYGPEDLSAISNSGHEIGCHTFGHSRTSRLTKGELEDDIGKNLAFLTGMLPGLRLEDFAYPFGDASMRSKRILQRHFASCRGTQPGLNHRRADLGLLKAVAPGEHQMDRAEIAATINDAATRKGWLIFFTHDIAESPSQWGCSPSLLDEAVRLARQSGARVVTVGEALALISGPGRG